MGNRVFRVVQISDLHLNPDDQQGVRRLESVRKRVADLKPDLIVASGDVSAEGYLRENVLARVKAELDKFSAPVHVIPGNHDVGNKMGIPSDPICPQYLAHWKQVFHSDRFCVEHGPWMLLGLNTQIIGSGFPEEAEQLLWLDQCLDRAEKAGQQVAFFLHAPPYINHPNEVLQGKANYWVFDPLPRKQMLERINRPHVRLLANGHLHWHLTFQRGSLQWVWCPSVAFIVDDATFPRGGGVSGVMQYEFNSTDVHHCLVPMELSVPTIWIHRPVVDLPAHRVLTIAELVCDFNGTLSKDGDLMPGLAAKLAAIGQAIRVTVITADSFGKAAQELAGLPVELKIIRTGAEKARYVRELGPERVVAIGNGRNDVAMFAEAAVGIAVIGPEGVAGELLREADIVVQSIHDALDLISHPMRLRASLRD